MGQDPLFIYVTDIEVFTYIRDVDKARSFFIVGIKGIPEDEMISIK